MFGNGRRGEESSEADSARERGRKCAWASTEGPKKRRGRRAHRDCQEIRSDQTVPWTTRRAATQRKRLASQENGQDTKQIRCQAQDCYARLNRDRVNRKAWSSFVLFWLGQVLGTGERAEQGRTCPPLSLSDEKRLEEATPALPERLLFRGTLFPCSVEVLWCSDSATQARGGSAGIFPPAPSLYWCRLSLSRTKAHSTPPASYPATLAQEDGPRGRHRAAPARCVVVCCSCYAALACC